MLLMCAHCRNQGAPLELINQRIHMPYAESASASAENKKGLRRDLDAQGVTNVLTGQLMRLDRALNKATHSSAPAAQASISASHDVFFLRIHRLIIVIP